MSETPTDINIIQEYGNANGLPSPAELIQNRLDASQNPHAASALDSERQGQIQSFQFADSIRTDVKSRYPNEADRFTPGILLRGIQDLQRGKPISHELRLSLQANGMGTVPIEDVRIKLADKILAEQDSATSLNVAYKINQHLRGNGGRLSSLIDIIRSNGLKDIPSLMKGVMSRDLSEYTKHRKDELLVHTRLAQAQDAYTRAGEVMAEASRYLQVDRTIPTSPKQPLNPNALSPTPNQSAKIDLHTRGLSSSVGGRSGRDEDAARSMTKESSFISNAALVPLCKDIGKVSDGAQHEIDFAQMSEQDIKSTYDQLRQLQVDGKFGGIRVLADGMGGMGSGESASRVSEYVAQKYILEALNRNEPVNEKMLSDAVLFADNALVQWNKNTNNKSGTTFVCTLTNAQGETLCASVGDSRIYSRKANGDMSSMFVDQSLMSQLVFIDSIKPSEVLTHPDKNIIASSLGDKNKPLKPSEIQIQKIKMSPGESLLMVCDGVWEDIDHTKYAPQLDQIDTEYRAEVQKLINSGVAPDKANSDAYKRAMGKMMEIQYREAEQKVKANPTKYRSVATALANPDMGKISGDNVSAIELVAETAPGLPKADPLMAGVPFRIYDNTPASKPVRGMILEYDMQTAEPTVQWTDGKGVVRTEKMTKSELERRIKQDNPPPPPASVSRTESPHDLDAYIEDQRIKGYVNYPMADGTPISANTLEKRVKYLNQHTTLQDISQNFPPCFQDAAWSIVRHQRDLAKARSVI